MDRSCAGLEREPFRSRFREVVFKIPLPHLHRDFESLAPFRGTPPLLGVLPSPLWFERLGVLLRLNRYMVQRKWKQIEKMAAARL